MHAVEYQHDRGGELLGGLHQTQREAARGGVGQRVQGIGGCGAHLAQARAHVRPEPVLPVIAVYGKPDHLARGGPGRRPRGGSAGRTVQVPVLLSVAGRDILGGRGSLYVAGRETGRQIMRLLLTVVRSEGITALVATHDDALIDLADEVIRLEDGRITS